MSEVKKETFEMETSEVTTKQENPNKSGKHGNKNRKNRENPGKSSGRIPRRNGTSNDASWYGAGKPNANNVANFYFSNANGLPLDFIHKSNVNNNADVMRMAVPGIAVHYVTHAFGAEKGSESPLNSGSNAEFALLRRANAGGKNYEAPDMMTFILGMAEVYALINHLIRAYGTVNKYYTDNKYFGQKLLEAMGFDWDSAHGRRADFASHINSIVALASQYALPANLPYFTRRAYLYSHVYMESDTVKSQMYLFRPNGFYKYMDPDDSHPEAYLRFSECPLSGETWTIDEWYRYALDLFDHLMICQDATVISGDISRAFGNNIIKLTWINDNYMLQPVPHDYNVLYQIRNATLCAEYTPTDLHQNASKTMLEYDPHVSAADTTDFQFELETMSGNRLITSDNFTPTAGEVLESTRFMAMWSDIQEVAGGLVAHPCIGTEVMTHIDYIQNYSWSSNPYMITTRTVTLNRAVEFDPFKLALIGCFKYHPMLIQAVQTDEFDPATISIGSILQDLDNVTVISESELAKIHHFAIRHLLAQPAIDALGK